ncbi:MAG: glycoside hydrolase, partial [Candidatus Kapaibacterium sp.]
DKQVLARAQIETVRRIVPLHQELAKRGQIELTTSPFYHPILPLLIDTDIAREAMADVELPKNRFRAPEEAENQIEQAQKYFAEKVGTKLSGMWPSEGSLSADTLALIWEKGFVWTASDESVLANSLAGKTIPAGKKQIRPEHARFFPWRFDTANGEIVIFFRDHGLSDDIGFTYQNWNTDDACNHFLHNILHIRSELIAVYGEEIMETACISVILDGENCWEYYPNNGLEFLDKFYSMLTTTPEIRPVMFSEMLAGTKRENLPKLPHFVAGSWINANFGIWIGHPEDNASWDALFAAHSAVENERANAEKLNGANRAEALARIEQARSKLMIAEGSDWCWWYGDEHFSAQKDLFDELYRMHLREVYRAIDLAIPEDLSIPIAGRFSKSAPAAKYGAMHPVETVA